jgi:hypothetical protein
VSVIAIPFKDPDHATRGRSAHFVRVSRVHTHDAGVQRSTPLPLPCPSADGPMDEGYLVGQGSNPETASRQ